MLPEKRPTAGGDTPCDARAIDARPAWQLAVGTVVALVANVYEVLPSEIYARQQGPAKCGAVSMARHVVWYILRERLNIPCHELGSMFGGRHHSTVLAGVRKVANAVEHGGAGGLGQTAKNIAQIVYELDGEV